MEVLRNGSVGDGQSLIAKALPPPPQSNDIGRRGKTNAFPSSNRALPPLPKSSTTSNTISRRPVGGQADKIDQPKMQPAYKAYVKKEQHNNLEAERAPPFPPKDSKTRQLPDLPEPLGHIHSSSISSTGSSPKLSSPRPEIWRRRSIKSERSVNISDLKLKKSNGSTASLSSINQSTAAPESSDPLPPIPSQTSRALVGLPGRSIKKPVSARPVPPQSDPMGAKLSKTLKLEIKDSLDGADKEKPIAKLSGSQISPYTRLPTPEYQLNDMQLQYSPVPQVFSPVSPISPETPPVDRSPEVRPDLPPPDEKAGVRLSFLNLDIPSPLLPGNNRDSNLPFDIISDYAGPISAHPHKPSVSSIQTIKPTPPRNSRRWPSTSGFLRSSTICSSVAVSVVHLDCYQAHRNMRPSRNDICSLACMICEVNDSEKRWNCAWCSLRCCDACKNGLASVPGNDLRKFLDWIGRNDRLPQQEIRAGG